MNSTIQKMELYFWQMTALLLDAIHQLLSQLLQPNRYFYLSPLLQFFCPLKGLDFMPLLRIALLSAACGFFTGVLLKLTN